MSSASRIARSDLPRRSPRRRLGAAVAAIGLLAGLLPAAAALPPPVAAAGESLPAGFVPQAIRTGLNHPTVVVFAPGGRVFVAEKQGVVKTWKTYADFAGATAATVTLDIKTDVDDYWDRGLLGLAVDPGYPAKPYVYVLYSADLTGIGGTTPRWNDTCPTPPGPSSMSQDGCVVYGRLERIAVDPSTGVATGGRLRLIEDWCQQYPSHSTGTVAFAPDGMLYVSAGDGANFNGGDYGQNGGRLPDTTNPVTPANPCADPPGSVGAALSAPTAEGGALRSQSARRATGEPVSLDGSILRIDPATGAAAPGNPFSASADPNRRRIVAYGLRNPFRFAVQPGTGDLWIGDVGYNTWEEVDRAPNPATAATAPNFGWPCFEGPDTATYYGATALDLCTSLPKASTTAPFRAYNHGGKTVPGDACPPVPPSTSATASVSGVAFYGGSSYPPAYRDGLFVADYSRDCITFIGAGPGGQPDAANAQPFGALILNPVYLTNAPDNGDIVYADFDGGAVRRIRYQAPTAAFTASPDQGAAPLDVSLDPGASGSAPGTSIASYAWDFDGDDVFDVTTTGPDVVRHTFPEGDWQVRLRVTDSNGVSADAVHQVTPGNTAPTVTLAAPLVDMPWSVGDDIAFAASATDTQDGTLPASAFAWTFSVVHCIVPGDFSNCHVHDVEQIPSAGHPTPLRSGTWLAPDHDYPSYLRLTVRVTDSGGLSDTKSVTLTNPRTSSVTVGSNPAGAALSIDGVTTNGPVTVLRGHEVSVAAPASFSATGLTFVFRDWSDGGGQSHTVTASGASLALSADYVGAPNPVTFRTTPISSPVQVGTGVVADGTSVDLPQGSHVQVTALTPVIVGESTWVFASWSDGVPGASRDYVAPSSPSTLTATYTEGGGVGGVTDQPDSCAGTGFSTPGVFWPGRIGTPGDVDWYRFALTSTRTARIVLRDLPIDARLDLYRGCSTLVASSDAAGIHWEELLPRLGAGTYALKVSGHGDAADLGLYRLRVSPLAETASVLAYRTRVDAPGRLRIVGEVLNNTAYRRGPIRVTARLYDAAGHLLATRSANADRSVAGARTRVPFRIAGSLPAGYDHVRFSVSAPRTSAWPLSPTVSGLGITTVGTGWRVSGTLTNRYSYTVRYARALVTLYDLNGVILDTRSVYPSDRTLSHGESRPFVVTFVEPGLPPGGTLVRASASH